MTNSKTDETYPDGLIIDILNQTRVVAMVGASPHWNRPSFFAMKYLQGKGYRVIPVNPKAAAAGQKILGETAYPDLQSIPEKIDIVNVFRKPEALPDIAREAISIGARILWMQLGLRNAEAAERARKAGLVVIMNRCLKFEYARYFGEMGWAGFNSRVISSKRRRLRS
jgi:predicted CoA-binding protein